MPTLDRGVDPGHGPTHMSRLLAAMSVERPLHHARQEARPGLLQNNGVAAALPSSSRPRAVLELIFKLQIVQPIFLEGYERKYQNIRRRKKYWFKDYGFDPWIKVLHDVLS